jgi:membrane protein YqaA with SNARE-associated domain
MPTFSPDTGLLGLFVSAFVSATLLPGGSELVLVAVLHAYPAAFWLAIAVATIGNTLGGMSSYWIGRLVPNRVEPRALTWLRRHGLWALLFSWLPVVGDALAVGAGWLRLNPWWALLALALGKLLRYLLVAGGWRWFAASAG